MSPWSSDLRGAIVDLTGMTSLSLLKLQATSLQAALSDLNNLQQLNLHTNQLSGAIPSELGNLTNLTRLRIGGVDGNRGNTGLTGCVPSALRDATDSDDLALAGTSGIQVCSP